MEAGAYLYKGKPVFVTDHQYYGSNGGICNFVGFRPIRKDGTLGKRAGDYDHGQFKPIKFRVQVSSTASEGDEK